MGKIPKTPGWCACWCSTWFLQFESLQAFFNNFYQEIGKNWTTNIEESRVLNIVWNITTQSPIRWLWILESLNSPLLSQAKNSKGPPLEFNNLKAVAGKFCGRKKFFQNIFKRCNHFHEKFGSQAELECQVPCVKSLNLLSKGQILSKDNYMI